MPATLDSIDVLALSSRAHRCSAWSGLGSVVGVVGEVLVDGVGDVSLECAHGFFAGLSLGLFAEVVDAARGVVADLGDCGHVDRVVQLAVTSRVQPVPFLGS